jgi:hypothetical protein
MTWEIEYVNQSMIGYFNFVSLQKFAVRHEVREGGSEVVTSSLSLCL